jgi:hypothetical protein
MSTEANVIECLGSPEQIADAAVREFRQRKNLLSRSPLAAFCTFVLSPLPMLCLAWLTTALLFALVGEGIDLVFPSIDSVPDSDILNSPLAVLAAYSAFLAMWLVPAAGLAGLYGRLARRTGRSWLWGLTACVLVALGTGEVNYTLILSEIPEKSVVMFGVGWTSFKICQFLFPLGVGFLVLQRTIRNVHRATMEPS